MTADSLIVKLEALKVQNDADGQSGRNWRSERNYVISECIAIIRQHFTAPDVLKRTAEAITLADDTISQFSADRIASSALDAAVGDL
jgi:hypothetical protein